MIGGDRPDDGTDEETSSVRLHETVVPSGAPVTPGPSEQEIEGGERLLEGQAHIGWGAAILLERVEQLEATLQASREETRRLQERLQEVEHPFDASEFQALREETRRLREALRPFAQPRATERTSDLARPAEDDWLWVEVLQGDWWRACVALGVMDVDYLRALPDASRPSEAFIAALTSPAPDTEKNDV